MVILNLFGWLNCIIFHWLHRTETGTILNTNGKRPFTCMFWKLVDTKRYNLTFRRPRQIWGLFWPSRPPEMGRVMMQHTVYLIVSENGLGIPVSVDYRFKNKAPLTTFSQSPTELKFNMLTCKYHLIFFMFFMNPPSNYIRPRSGTLTLPKK